MGAALQHKLAAGQEGPGLQSGWCLNMNGNRLGALLGWCPTGRPGVLVGSSLPQEQLTSQPCSLCTPRPGLGNPPRPQVFSGQCHGLSEAAGELAQKGSKRNGKRKRAGNAKLAAPGLHGAGSLWTTEELPRAYVVGCSE